MTYAVIQQLLDRIELRERQLTDRIGEPAARLGEAEAEREVPPAPAAPTLTVAAAAPTAGALELVEQIKQLAALHAQGVLSDAEFAAAKSKLLGTGVPHDDAPRRC